ncbi:substrate-binding domain-containing protein [Schlegelella aquatica]|uniref:substrate-binding domain-containing protein n=1 Tax=Caldimonas aquatica TaxID=376175 RepID=UPI0037513D48
MHRIHLTYALGDSGDSPRELHHPLMRLLDAIHVTGSISGAARELDLSYRHVWGELKRWEQELGQDLVVWSKGQPARLSQFGEKLLWAERRAKARLAPQIDALRSELERAFAIAFDPHAEVLTLYASHDNALPLLRETAARDDLHLDMRFTGSTEALQALNRGVCTVAGFHAHVRSPLRSPTARAYRPLLKPGRHKLIGFARRTQGLIVAPGNPSGIQGLADLTRGGLRFVNRPWGAGTRVLLEQLLAQQRIPARDIVGFDREEPSHDAVAEAVASGSADVAFGIESAARQRGLDFVPITQEGYFLVTLREHLEQPELQHLRRILQARAWQERLERLRGYEPDRSGEVLSLRSVLPWWSYRRPKA